jgi:Flp pilus assembly pilin Flp
MKRMSSLGRFFSDTRGDTGFVEWVILVGVIAIVGIAAFTAVGSAVSEKAEDAASEIEGLG